MKSALRLSLKVILFSITVIVSIIGGQISQHLAHIKDSRMHTIDTWNRQHPENLHVSRTFINECLNRKMVKDTSSDEPFFVKEVYGLYECGIEVGADDLVDKIKESDNSLSTFAWPLSVLT
ncbi:hypothetical protein HJ202_18955 [Vibrio parahaemolyticus]|uniref:hypothetical protein n=2 Tax=Vibrio harveyi group TaxID=717610 RepID=UPI000A36BFC7|nr:hypothetical protein [Vibrio parahaemolyticus]MBE3722408.1 hypothetical protein [Vibrio parahaemolyticus]MBE4244890.1 hypothetical protein [Vibrio parahaemolyticus]OUJ50986.1 hypothetical protein BTM22_11965 [Vibrio parahaemolyticus]TOO96836.1 hypothetical protein CGH27_24595 [Vibrio parahaemolyticus]TOP08680.1 hypothetical protein CGH26_18705 [Vibrio parahaemolyticus]